MSDSRNHHSEVVAMPNFPAYAVEAVSGRYAIVGGGGGAARTGIRNKFDVYELYHNGKQTTAERVVSHDVGSACISNLVAWCVPNSESSNLKIPGLAGKKDSIDHKPIIYLALGQDERCDLLKLTSKYDLAKPVDDVLLEESIFDKKEKSNSAVRNRAKAGNNSNTSFEAARNEAIIKRKKQERIRRESINSTLRGDEYFTFDVDVLHRKKTIGSKAKEAGGSPEDVYQKVVQVSPDHSMIATGGTDGFVRIWSVPTFELITEFEAHTKEVDDLDWQSDSLKLVTVCKQTRQCIIWNVNFIKQSNKNFRSPNLRNSSSNCIKVKKEFSLNIPTNGVRYKFYKAKFSTPAPHTFTKTTKKRLFTISNAVSGRKQSGVVAYWGGDEFTLIKDTPIKSILACLAVSQDGKYLATGTMDGDIYLIIAFSLQVLRRIQEAHPMFVTSLSWLPSNSETSKMVRGFSEASVLSISCDNMLKIHHIPRQQMIPVWFVSVLAVILLFCTFLFASYLGI